MATTQAIGPLSGIDHASELRRAVIASTVGTTIEWYDFFLYSTVTGLVFAKLYFPNSDPLVGTLNSFLIYFVGFLSRPIGAAIFGHYGDRIGRKSTLIATLMLMGIATFLVAFVPGYDMIGIWGAIILTLLRFIQGIGVGGEWGGSVLLAMEWARHNNQRGFVASWPQFGVPAGLFIANLAVLSVSAISGDAFLTWGWRVPFLLSIVLVGIGLWIRLGIHETPTFRRLVEEKKIERAPFIEVIKKQPVEILLTAFARVGQQAPYYIFTAFIFAYGTGTSACFARSAAGRRAGRFLYLVHHDPARRPRVRSFRPQEDLYPWRDRDRALRLRLFRPARHHVHGLDLHRGGGIADRT